MLFLPISLVKSICDSDSVVPVLFTEATFSAISMLYNPGTSMFQDFCSILIIISIIIINKRRRREVVINHHRRYPFSRERRCRWGRPRCVSGRLERAGPCQDPRRFELDATVAQRYGFCWQLVPAIRLGAIVVAAFDFSAFRFRERLRSRFRPALYAFAVDAARARFSVRT